MAPAPFGTTDLTDRHVAAAAVHVAPSVLVTWNLKDFDREILHGCGVVVLSPDRFLRRVLDRSPAAVPDFTRQAQANLSRTAPTWDAYPRLLSRISLADFVAGIQAYEADLDAEEGPAVDGEPESRRLRYPETFRLDEPYSSFGILQHNRESSRRSRPMRVRT